METGDRCRGSRSLRLGETGSHKQILQALSLSTDPRPAEGGVTHSRIHRQLKIVHDELTSCLIYQRRSEGTRELGDD